MAEGASEEVVLASDGEREHAVLRLRDAVVEGRLTLEEFSERVGVAHRARTGRELATLTRDIPPAGVPIPAGPERRRERAFFSQLVRRGPLALPAHSAYRSLFGTIELDLRDAILAAPEVQLDVSNIFGTVSVIVPEGAEVVVEGSGLFATTRLDIAPSPLLAAAPRIRLRASGLGGTLNVRRHARCEPLEHPSARGELLEAGS
jgi:hypothetical protein